MKWDFATVAGLILCWRIYFLAMFFSSKTWCFLAFFFVIRVAFAQTEFSADIVDLQRPGAGKCPSFLSGSIVSVID